MTKKHYEAIASILKPFVLLSSDTSPAMLAEQLANYFASDNPKFSTERFLTACGYDFKKCPDCGSNIDPEYNCCYNRKCDYFA
jgi:hypothetical protein